jgi:hypothetical protein
MHDEIEEKLLELDKQHTDKATNHVDLDGVLDDLEQFLSTRRDLLDTLIQARFFLKRHDDRRCSEPFQGRFAFVPEAWLTIGHKIRVEMSKASREDIYAHVAILSRNHSGVVRSYSEKMSYFNERLQKWGKHKTLGAVETSEFPSA